MVCVAGEDRGILEVWDLAGDGDEPVKFPISISQNYCIAQVAEKVAALFKRKVGTFGMLLKWGRIKVNLTDVKPDRTIAEIGVDFTSGTTYTLVVTEWSSSPSDSDESSDKETKNTSEADGVSVPGKIWSWSSESSPDDTEIKPLPKWQECSADPDERAGESERKEKSEKEVLRELPTIHRERFQRSSRRSRMSAIDVTQPAWVEEKWNMENPYLNPTAGAANRQRSERGGIANQDTNRRSENTYLGLVNQAMTCYLNSLLQALYMTPEFRNALYNWEYVHSSEKDEATSIPYQLQKLFLNLQTSSKNAIETTSLTKSFGWDSTEAWHQHDIQELCRVMFDALEQKFKNTEQADLINRLYEGKMIDYVKCLECGTENSREDTFLDIPLPIRPFGSTASYGSVQEALSAFVQPETLDGTNQYHCETCNKKCDAHKGLKFSKFPYFLTLHLKRFDFDYNTFHRIKLNDEVTFPYLLNLNSFIPPSGSEGSACTEEDCGSVEVKCEDGSTTDSGNLDDEGPPCDNGMSVSDHSTNDNREEEEEDEGIERSNGPSTSSCNSHNSHDTEKNRENKTGPSGPYEYELFSIMIHSGSASGGHYYAYIKDFRTSEWLCFNDQNVSSITYDDIEKTYGGGPTKAYYSGVYSSSTNAYMLMYRQIDPVRNSLPMQVSDFPKHLQEMLVNMQESDYNDMKNRVLLIQACKLRIYCKHPIGKELVHAELVYVNDDESSAWEHLTDEAYKRLQLKGVVSREDVRLVFYDERSRLVNGTYDEKEMPNLHAALYDQPRLLMEIRKPDEPFKTYLPGGIAKRVFLIDVVTEEVVKAPVVVRSKLSYTVSELRDQLSELLGMEAKDINIIFQYLEVAPRLITKMEKTLEQENYNSVVRIFVQTLPSTETKKSVLDDISDITYKIYGLISLNVRLPDLSKEALRAQNIPTLEEKMKAAAATSTTTKAAGTPDNKTENKESRAEKVDSKQRQVPRAPIAEMYREGKSQNQVGCEEPEASSNKTTTKTPTAPENKSESRGEKVDSKQLPRVPTNEINREAKSEKNCGWEEVQAYLIKNPSSSAVLQTEAEDWVTPEQSNSEDSSLSYSDRTLVEDEDYGLASIDPEPEAKDHFFYVSPDDLEPDTLLRVLVDKRMTQGPLNKLLEPYIGVPVEYFRVNSEHFYGRMSMDLSLHDEGATISIKLGIALCNDELKVSLYLLCPDSETEPFSFICEWIVSKEATVGEAKKEILAELKEKYFINIPFERCRFRRKSYKTAANVFLDDQKFKHLRFHCLREIVIQELPGKETVTDPNDVVLFARRMPAAGLPLGPFEEVVLSSDTIAEVRQKFSELSGIPEKHLEIARGRTLLPDEMVKLYFLHSSISWNRFTSTSLPEDRPVGLDDGTIMYYRDRREKARETSASENQDKISRKPRMNRVSSDLRNSPKREKALKIYVDDK